MTSQLQSEDHLSSLEDGVEDASTVTVAGSISGTITQGTPISGSVKSNSRSLHSLHDKTNPDSISDSPNNQQEQQQQQAISTADGDGPVPRSQLQSNDNDIAIIERLESLEMNTIPPQADSGSMTPNETGEEESFKMSQSSRRRTSILIVLSSTTCTFTACGLNFAFGVFQEVYEQEARKHDGNPFMGVSAGKIDLIGTIAVSLMMIGAPWASSWTTNYGPSKVTAVGGILFGLGMITAGLAEKLGVFYITQGVLVGIGTCLSYIPSVTVCPGWFTERRGLAMGIVLSGTGIGGVIWAPLTRYLITTFDYHKSLQILGGIGAALLLTASTVLRWSPEALDAKRRAQMGRVGESRNRKRMYAVIPVDWRIARGRLFVAKSLAATSQAAAYYMPIYFIASYARRLGMNSKTGAGLISLSNGLSAIGKIILGYVADRYGRINTLYVCTLLSALSVLTLWAPGSVLSSSSMGTEKGLFISFVVLYGITAGVYVSLFPTVLVEIFGVQHFASVNGFLYMVRGFGTLVGTPTAGLLITGGRESTNSEGIPSGNTKGFLNSILMIGGLLCISTLGVMWIRWEIGRRDGWKWKG